MQMEMSFPGGLEVNAEVKGFTIRTDQPEKVVEGERLPRRSTFFLPPLAPAPVFTFSSSAKSEMSTPVSWVSR